MHAKRPTQSPPGSPCERGFLMVEVLLAIALLAVAMLAVLGIMPIAMDLQHGSTDEAAQLFAAQQKLDALLVSNVFISPTYSTDAPLSNSSRRWRSLPDLYGSSALQIIEVDVLWKQGGRARSISLYGMVAP